MFSGEKEAGSPDDIKARILGGGEITPAEVLSVAANLPRTELHALAEEVTNRFRPERFDFCAIINARSGRCGENCKWCAQSAHWNTKCESYGWIGAEACASAAAEAERNGVGRIAIVTAGRGQSPAQIDEICEALRAMAKSSRIHLCGSLGILSEYDLKKLKAAGLERIHCNIETAPSLFPALCSTHTSAEKIATLRRARAIGLEICCGGIVGMGETKAQLVEFAFALREIAPDSIPVNVLDPIPGTPLGSREFLPVEEILDAIAVIRIVNPQTSLRFAGGRRRLSDADATRAIRVGIDAGIQGPLLTTPGSDYADDRQLAKNAGYKVEVEN